MYSSDIGFTDYEEYRHSKQFKKLRERVGVGKKKCSVWWCEKVVRLPHHLTYENLGREKKSDVRGVCFSCNDLCHFYDTGYRVPVTSKGEDLSQRWDEINSYWYWVKNKRPSDFFNWLFRLGDVY